MASTTMPPIPFFKPTRLTNKQQNNPFARTENILLFLTACQNYYIATTNCRKVLVVLLGFRFSVLLIKFK